MAALTSSEIERLVGARNDREQMRHHIKAAQLAWVVYYMAHAVRLGMNGERADFNRWRLDDLMRTTPGYNKRFDPRAHGPRRRR